MQRIVTLNSHHTFQMRRPLYFSISNGLTSWWSQLTLYRELALSRLRILFEQSLNVGYIASLSDRRPNGMTGPHLDFRTDLGNRRNISGCA